MFKKAALAGLALSLSIAATPAAAWELVDWNGGQVWGEEWTPTTKLTWDTNGVDVWYRVYFEGFTTEFDNGNTALPGLASTVLYKLTDIGNNGKDWTFEYVVENASDQWVTDSQVSLIGFDVDPNVKSQNGVYLFAGGEYRTVGKGDFDLSDDVGYRDDFEVCFTTKGSFNGNPTNKASDCEPGENVGPEMGESGFGKFILKFNQSQTQVSFLNPVVGYDNIDFNQPQARGTQSGSYYDSKHGKGHKHDKGCGHKPSDDGVGVPVAYVPEPSTWAMMILGFGAAGTILRRQRRAIAA